MVTTPRTWMERFRRYCTEADAREAAALRRLGWCMRLAGCEAACMKARADVDAAKLVLLDQLLLTVDRLKLPPDADQVVRSFVRGPFLKVLQSAT